MRSDDPASSKYKRVSTYLPNLVVITKSATPGEIHATYVHASVGNNSLGETFIAFALTGSIEAQPVVSINMDCAFAGNGENIRLPTTEFLLRAAAGKPVKSKNLRDWTFSNAVLLPPFLTDIALPDVETASEALLKISAERINYQEGDNAAEDSDAEEESRSDKDNNKSAKTRSTKDAAARDAMDGIAADFDNILSFLQAVALKAPRVWEEPLSM